LAENQPPILRTEHQQAETPRYVVCDNCKCGLTIPANGEPGGQVFKMSSEAVEQRDYREKTQKEIQRKDEEITALNSRIVELQGRVRELEPKQTERKRLFQW
jgi:hypothetical protein